MTGADVKRIRKSWGMTQQELADLLGYSVHTISDIEREKKQVSEMMKKHIVAVKRLREITSLSQKFDE